MKGFASGAAQDGARVAAGDKQLHTLHVVEYIILPPFVQFAHYIVQKGNGGFVCFLLQNFRLRQLQGEHTAALLALTAVLSGRDPV